MSFSFEGLADLKVVVEEGKSMKERVVGVGRGGGGDPGLRVTLVKQSKEQSTGHGLPMRRHVWPCGQLVLINNPVKNDNRIRRPLQKLNVRRVPRLGLLALVKLFEHRLSSCFSFALRIWISIPLTHSAQISQDVYCPALLFWKGISLEPSALGELIECQARVVRSDMRPIPGDTCLIITSGFPVW